MTEKEVERVYQDIVRKRRRSGLYQIVLAFMMAALVLFGLHMYNDLNDEKRVSHARDAKIGALEAALDAQRAQFERCKNLPPTATGCAEPIAPSSNSIPGPEGPQGIQGIPGPIGPQGLQGPRGLQGMMGKKGEKGEVGATGATGAPGPQGVPGAKGDQGPKGDAGETGPQGPVGPSGPACPDGYTGSQQMVLTKDGFQTVFLCVQNP